MDEVGFLKREKGGNERGGEKRSLKSGINMGDKNMKKTENGKHGK